MSADSPGDTRPWYVGVAEEIEPVCRRFEAELRAGSRPRIKDYLPQVSEQARAALVAELLRLEIPFRIGLGETILAADYNSDFPYHANLIERLLAPRPEEIAQAARYRLEEEIGHGGMGDVYRAHDPDFNRPLAVKVLKEEYADRSDMVARFLEEAQITGQLQHPGIPPVHHICRLADGRRSIHLHWYNRRGEPLQRAAARHRPPFLFLRRTYPTPVPRGTFVTTPVAVDA